MTLLTTTSSVALPQWTAFFNNFPLFLKAFLYTLGVSLAALLLAMVLGVIIGGLSTAKQKETVSSQEYTWNFIKTHPYWFKSSLCIMVLLSSLKASSCHLLF